MPIKKILALKLLIYLFLRFVTVFRDTPQPWKLQSGLKANKAISFRGFVLHMIFYHNCFNYMCVEKDINYVKLEQKRIVPAQEALHTVSFD